VCCAIIRTINKVAGRGVGTALPGEDDRTEPASTRFHGRYGKRGKIEALPYQRHRFPQRYTRADLELLATVDAAHENLSGPATRRILEREYRQYGKLEYQRLAAISVAISTTYGNSHAIGNAVFTTSKPGPHGGHRGTAETRSTRPPGLSAGRHRAPRIRREAKAVSHQCRR